MFNTLESAWDLSARRGLTTVASFTLQAFAVSLLLAVSLLWVGQPPHVRWLQLSTPASFTPQPQAATQPGRMHRTTAAVSLLRPEQMIAPSIPLHPAAENLDPGPSAPNFEPGSPGTGRGSDVGVVEGLGSLPVVIPSRPAPVKPLVISQLAEANLLHKVQPVYPPLAREARVQGAVELRAIISKAGTI